MGVSLKVILDYHRMIINHANTLPVLTSSPPPTHTVLNISL